MSQIIFSGISILLLLFASGLRAGEISLHASSNPVTMEQTVQVMAPADLVLNK